MSNRTGNPAGVQKTTFSDDRQHCSTHGATEAMPKKSYFIKSSQLIDIIGVPGGIRTLVCAVKGRTPDGFAGT
jgi:hypothetical protein